MLQRLSSREFAFTASAVLAAALLAAVPWAAMAQGDVGARIDEHLAAGEFGPARALAAGADAGLRDRFLGRIAGAQADAGARRASLSTLRDIGNDQIRSGALGSLASTPLGGRGGAAAADFDSLIELITSTVRPTTWEEVGGPGAIEPFPGGVYVDPTGVLKTIAVAGTARLSDVRRAAAAASGNRDVHAPSPLRKVSLTRLERELQLLWAEGLSPDEAMQNLAGLQKIEYVLVYPDTGDIVLAGPAGDWKTNTEGRTVGAESGRPVLQLDDFVVLLRNAFQRDATFSCSIVPDKESLARTKAYMEKSTRQPLKPGRAAREKWLHGLRTALGRQHIEIKGIDPQTRVARVIVEADYHMKLIGMGLEEGTLGVESYLDSIKLAKGEAPPPVNVLRWWFTLNYDGIAATKAHNAFALKGQGVKVLAENELLTELGERVHTGKSDELTSRFARSFTKHFARLAAKYPVYAELENIFDLALVTAIMRSEDLPAQVDWHMTHFGDGQRYQVQLGTAPAEVDTVINHRVVNGNQILAGVSGGVAFQPHPLLKKETQTASSGEMEARRHSEAAPALPKQAWWWD